MTRQHFWRRGDALIVVGMLIVVAAQFWTNLPVVTAIALVGRGVINSLRSRPRTSRRDSLILLNLSVYGTLVCLAIVAQSNAVLQASSRVSFSMLLDHAAAIVLLVGLICGVFYRLSQPAA